MATRSFVVTVGYNVCHANHVSVRAHDAEQACERAIAAADNAAAGWRSTDGASKTYAVAVELGGEEIAVPARFTEVGTMAPELIDLRRVLEQVAAIAEDQWTDAHDTVNRMLGVARDALEKAAGVRR